MTDAKPRRIGFLDSCDGDCGCVMPIVYEETYLFYTKTLWAGGWMNAEDIADARRILAEKCTEYGAENKDPPEVANDDR